LSLGIFLNNIDEVLEVEGDIFLIHVSKNVTRIREQKKMSKLEVSRLMGFYVPDHYSRMELSSNGKHFNLKHIYKLSKIFDVEISELLGISDFIVPSNQ